MFGDNPVELFNQWYKLAKANGIDQRDCMALATSTLDGAPSCRIVLFKGFFDDGIVFYTNYLSRKAKELEKNPRGSLVFHWMSQNQNFHRQIRFEGTIERTSEQLSDQYWKTRPRESQISSSISPQSQVIDRDTLEKAFEDFSQKTKGHEIPRPAGWGGFVLKPNKIEFWVGSPHRFHDRALFTKKGPTAWMSEELAP